MIKLNNHRALRVCGAGFAAAVLLALAPASHAATVFYKVTLNLGALNLNADAPFSLDLQLISGSGNATNTASIGNFTYNNVAFTGTPQLIAATGDSINGISLGVSPTTGFSDFYQQLSITNSTASISFVVAQSMNNEFTSGGSGTIAPDQFEVFIDDGNTADGYVPTSAPGGVDALAISSINSTETWQQVVPYISSSPDSGVTTAVAVPEPASAGLLLLGVAGLVARRRRA